jgi:dCTP deaminase
MILSDTEIFEAINRKEIIITPFKRSCLGSNSYDVHLGKDMAVYKESVVDSKLDNPVLHFEIKSDGIILQPGILYLGVTEEYTETHCHVPFLEGKSSTGRLGISIHSAAGKGDVGFCNFWTLELSVVHPVKVYPGMPIAQLIYFRVDGDIAQNYSDRPSAKYRHCSSLPVPSMMHLNFKKGKWQ